MGNTMGCGSSVCPKNQRIEDLEAELAIERRALADARKQLRDHGLAMPNEDDMIQAREMQLRAQDQYDVHLPIECFRLAASSELQFRVEKLESALAKAKTQLQMHRALKVSVQIAARNNAIVEYQVRANEPAILLKMLLHEADRSIPPPSDACLTLGGLELQNSDTFAQHDVKEDAVLVLASAPGITVNFSGHEETVAVIWPRERIGTMLTRVLGGGSPAHWSLHGELLDSDKLVSDCDISDGDVLEMKDRLLYFDGDLAHFKGVLHHLGTAGGTRKYQNPFDSGAIRMMWSDDAANYYSRSTGHRQGDINQSGRVICGEAHPGDNATQWSRGSPNAWFTIDIGDHALCATHYCYRGDAGGGGNHPRTWELKGSNDNRSWTTLVSHAGDHTVGWSTVGSFAIENGATSQYYRYFRIQNQGSPNHLCCSGIELYGRLMEGKHADCIEATAGTEFSISGWAGYNSRFNGVYTATGQTKNDRPVYSHQHSECVGAGHDWCRVWYNNDHWRIGHVSWVFGDDNRCVAAVRSDARDPSQISNGTWLEHPGRGCNQDHGYPESFKPAEGSPHIGTSPG